jgi:hypothetical protein
MVGLISILLSVTLSAEAFAPPPPAPDPPRTHLETGERYEVVATLDVSAGRLDAVETIRLSNPAGLPLSYVNLNVQPRAFGYYQAAGDVTVDGEPARTSWTTRTNLRVELPAPLDPGSSASLRLPFRLTVGSAGGAFTARLSRDRGVISFGQWLPMISPEHDIYAVGDPRITRSADRIRLELTSTSLLPRHAVACPGLVEAPAGSGTRWVCEIENARDFSFVVNPRFRLTERTVGGARLRVYTETVTGERTADLAQDALTRLEPLYGQYPWPDLVLAEVGADGGFSMEYPAAIHLTRTKVVDTYVLYHEVAHQWFYAQLGNDQQREPWLDEAFADFTARHLMGSGSRDQCSTRPVDSSVFAWPAGPTSGGDWLSCDGYFHTVFYKGSEFLYAIRSAMGDAAFFGALREHIARNRFGTTTTRRLLDHFQESTDADLAPIFARYLDAY